jgi:hypothetical protein
MYKYKFENNMQPTKLLALTILRIPNTKLKSTWSNSTSSHFIKMGDFPIGNFR